MKYVIILREYVSLQNYSSEIHEESTLKGIKVHFCELSAIKFDRLTLDKIYLSNESFIATPTINKKMEKLNL